MRDSGLAPHFDIYLGKIDDDVDTKPQTIRRVMERTGLEPQDAVMVGDRFYDVDAATEVGIPCVGVHYVHTCEVKELVDAGAVAVVTPELQSSHRAGRAGWIQHETPAVFQDDAA